MPTIMVALAPEELVKVIYKEQTQLILDPYPKYISMPFTVYFYCKKETISLDKVIILTHYQNKIIKKLIKDAKFYVTTNNAPSWKSLFHQRVRWAGKSTAYSSFMGKTTAIVVFLANSAFIGALILLFFG